MACVTYALASRLTIGDVELKGTLFFRRKRKSLEEHVDFCEI